MSSIMSQTNNFKVDITVLPVYIWACRNTDEQVIIFDL